MTVLIDKAPHSATDTAFSIATTNCAKVVTVLSASSGTASAICWVSGYRTAGSSWIHRSTLSDCEWVLATPKVKGLWPAPHCARSRAAW